MVTRGGAADGRWAQRLPQTRRVSELLLDDHVEADSSAAARRVRLVACPRWQPARGMTGSKRARGAAQQPQFTKKRSLDPIVRVGVVLKRRPKKCLRTELMYHPTSDNRIRCTLCEFCQTINYYLAVCPTRVARSDCGCDLHDSSFMHLYFDVNQKKMSSSSVHCQSMAGGRCGVRTHK